MVWDMTHQTTFTMTFLGGIREVVDSTDGGSPRLNDGMAVGILLVLSFKCVKGPKVGWE